MLVTPHVFIDTTVFDQSAHNYNSTAFQRLAELVEEKSITIHMTTITVREVESHIKRDVKTAQDNIRAAFSKHKLLKNVEHPSVSAVSIGVDVEEVTEALLARFRGWVSELSVNIIPIEGLSVEQVFDRYFEQAPPFSEKKKGEFPDAFTVAALERWCKENSARMYVVSGDGDMHSACQSSQSLHPCLSLAEFLELQTRGQKFAEYANGLFEAHKHLIARFIQKKSLLPLYIYFPYWEHDGLIQYGAETLTFPEKYLIEVEEGKAVFEALVKVVVRADLQAYSAGGRMVIPEEPTVRRCQFLKAEVSLLFDINDESNFRIEYVNIKEEAVPFYPQYSDYPDVYLKS